MLGLPRSLAKAIARLPHIGHEDSKDTMRAKWIVPNHRLISQFEGYYVKFIPAYGPVLAPEGHVKVLAILAIFPVIERPDNPPCCRLDDPETGMWAERLYAYAAKLKREGYRPADPTTLAIGA